MVSSIERFHCMYIYTLMFLSAWTQECHTPWYMLQLFSHSSVLQLTFWYTQTLLWSARWHCVVTVRPKRSFRDQPEQCKEKKVPAPVTCTQEGGLLPTPTRRQNRQFINLCTVKNRHVITALHKHYLSHTVTYGVSVCTWILCTVWPHCVIAHASILSTLWTLRWTEHRREGELNWNGHLFTSWRLRNSNKRTRCPWME